MDLFVFKRKRGEVLNHWFAPVDGFSYQPSEFYAAIEKEIEARKIPGLEMSRVEFAEGGMLSDKRVYLRMIRERLTFDVCAAPFGRYFFFSCRSVCIPPVIEIWDIVALAILFGGLYSLLEQMLGMQFGLVALAGLLLAIIQVFRNTIALGLSDLDATLIKTPVIGPVYERLFRKDSYFRQDGRLIYLEVVSNLVKEMAEDLCAAKGVKLLTQFENAPVLGDFYKPVPPSKPVKP